MLKTLNFVKGAVAKKDHTPVLTHFRIKEGRIQGSNGNLTIDCAIDLDLDVKVPADRFVKAIKGCGKTVPNFKVTDKGNMIIKAGKFRVMLPISNEPFPDLEPEGEEFPLSENFIDFIRMIKPFMNDDANQVWSCGVLIKKGSMYASNNKILVGIDAGLDVKLGTTIPSYAIEELLRIGEPPKTLQVTKTSATFLYENGSWLRTNLFDKDWPNLDEHLEGVTTDVPVPDGLCSAVKQILPFCPNADIPKIKLTPSGVCTDEGAMSAQVEGCVFEGENIFHAQMLLRVLDVAEYADFNQYPKPVPFIGFNGLLKGILIGLRA